MEEKRVRKHNITKYVKVFWVFIIGCLAGFIIEGIVTLLSSGHFELRQGVIYGPFAQVYGMGTLLFYFVLPHWKKNTHIFIISMVLGAGIEYLCSYLQEMWFGTVSWEYSGQMFNLNGRTSLFYALCWGVLGVFFSKKIYPFFQKLDNIVSKKLIQYISYACIVLMIGNFSISFLAGQRQKQRLLGKKPSSEIEEFLDVFYPDYRMNQIYANKRVRVDTDFYFYGK